MFYFFVNYINDREDSLYNLCDITRLPFMLREYSVRKYTTAVEYLQIYMTALCNKIHDCSLVFSQIHDRNRVFAIIYDQLSLRKYSTAVEYCIDTRLQSSI